MVGIGARSRVGEAGNAGGPEAVIAGAGGIDELDLGGRRLNRPSAGASKGGLVDADGGRIKAGDGTRRGGDGEGLVSLALSNTVPPPVMVTPMVLPGRPSDPLTIRSGPASAVTLVTLRLSKVPVVTQMALMTVGCG